MFTTLFTVKVDDAVIERTTEGIGILSPEDSFNVFVPKATSWRTLDLEKNLMKSLTFSIFNLQSEFC